jgi:Phage portal protein, SPP1 Gp6-like
LAGRFQKFTADYNLMTPEDMDLLLFEPFQVALGEETVERLQTQFENYEYYNGKQHRNENGELVKASELERPADLEYDPTRYSTNYFKAIINRKARWQMGGKHNVTVPRKQIDPLEETMQPGYQPSAEQQREDEIAEGFEKLIQQLWNENKMRAKLLQAARDRLIANRVVCKLAFNPNTGKLRWVFRPDTEYFPVYSDDDFEELIACHFIRQKIVDDGSEEVEAFQKQTFTLEGEGENRKCYIEEAVYTAEDLEVYEVITPKTSMEIDFIPVVEIPVNNLIGETSADSDIADLREQNDILNQMNEDAIDSLKFEMFSMTAVLNAPEGTAEALRIAPGAVLEARGYKDGSTPSIQKVEGGFRWKEAFKDQYMRVKGAMHEISGLPQIVPQELNFGGLNGDVLHVLFHDIISDTEEHWITWGYALKELHEKSVKYLQARVGEPNFAYDKDIVRKIEDYTTEIEFVLPLPDNRKELVELLGEEMAAQLESQAGAMRRLGVEDVKAKQEEIRLERMRMMAETDPYGLTGIEEDMPTTPSTRSIGGPESLQENSKGQKVDASGEPVEVCPVCNGSGRIIDKVTGENKVCDNCRGDGYVQIRKR